MFKATQFAKIYNGCKLYYVSSLISKSGDVEYTTTKKEALKLIDKKKAKALNVKL